MRYLSKRLVFAIVVLAVLVGVSMGTVKNGNAAPERTSASNTIYMVGSVTNNTFWSAVKNGFMAGAKEFGVKGVYVAPDQHAQTSQIPLIRAAIASKPGGIAINYQDRSFEKPTLTALSKGIRVSLFNNHQFAATGGDPSSETKDPRITGLAYVGEDSRALARRVATELKKSLKPGTTVVIFDPVPGVPVLALRRKGIEDVLRPAGFKTVYLPGKLDEAQNLAIIGSYLKAHKEVGGVAGLGNPTSNPAAQYAKKNKLKLPVSTFDSDSECIGLIKEGWMTVASNQQPWYQGYLSAMNLANSIKYGLSPVSVDTAAALVTKANVREVDRAVKAGRG